MKITKALTAAVLAFNVAFACGIAHGSLYLPGTFGSYAASDGQLAGGQTLTAWTIEMWVKPIAIGPPLALFNNAPIEPWKEIGMGVNPEGSFGFQVTWPQTYYNASTAPGTITANEWQHLSVVGDGTQMRLYRNGVLVASGSTPGQASFASTHSPNVVGAFSFGLSDYLTLPDANFYHGYLSDFRVWDRALPDAELLSYVTQEPSINAPGLRNWIPFNELSGNVFYDIVGGQNGAYYNATLSSDSPFATVPESPSYYMSFCMLALAAFHFRCRKS